MLDWEGLRATYDRSDMYGRIASLPDELDQAAAAFPDSIAGWSGDGVSNVLLLGMGGSAIGGDIVAAAVRDRASVPVTVVRGYSIPAYCGKSTIAIATSYSGNTEETLSATKMALAIGARLAAITSGGALGRIAESAGAPVISVPGGFPPRTALGLLTVPALLLLSRAGLVSSPEREIAAAAKQMKEMLRQWGSRNPALETDPAALAERLHGTLPVIYYGGGEMDPVATRWCGQFAENAKALSHRNSFPELNHNEIVGWENPVVLLGRTSIIVLDNENDDPRLARGKDVAISLLKAYPARVLRVAVKGESVLERILSTIYIGDWISYYLGLANGVDPTPVHRIDQLKAELAR